MDKKTAIQMMQNDFASFSQQKKDFSKQVQDLELDAKNYIQELLTQIKAGSGITIAKTPKPPKRKNTRIQAIPENEEMETDSSTLGRNDTASSVLEESDLRPVRAKRGASIKAADNIKKQQSITLMTKLRRPSKEDDESLSSKVVKQSRSKRPKSFSSDDEDRTPSNKKRAQSKAKKVDRDSEIDSTYVKDSHTITGSKKNKSLKRKLDDQDVDQDSTLTSEKSSRESSKSGPAAKKAHYSNSSPKKLENSKYINTLDKISESPSSKHSQESTKRITRSSSSSIINAHGGRKNKRNVINETVDTSNADETLASMYEDAIGKPLPIMNSTMNPSSAVMHDKMMNVTVLIEPMSTKKVMNETVTIKNGMFKEPTSNKKMNVTQVVSQGKVAQDDKIPEVRRKSSRNQKTTEPNKKGDRFTDLITDDESSPERKGCRSSLQRRSTRSNNSIVSDDEIQLTPVEKIKKNKDFKLPTSVKSAYKPAALFSPYAKDSVKKRVEAFEQVATSPQKVDIEVTGRVTRTKTRALAAGTDTPVQQTLAQKLARKSLAKAKKISLAKHTKEYDDAKENENANIIKAKKTSSIEKSTQKTQPKTTPLGKNRLLQAPTSANKNQFATPSNVQAHNTYSKPLTASRGNIVTHVDSFIQPMKSATKTRDQSEERRRRAHEEDARRKREEILKAQADEKRRKREEKELKNKLAREAKEKLELEKRLKAEREREEKARLAQQMQEKQKEELEKKRILQMHRAQEKEERRKQEELLRMQRLQEQEEQERLLAEQKRREQEMEKRKQAELRHQQMAELKAQKKLEKAALQAKQAKAFAAAAAQKQVANNYKIDSDPDEDDTDDECKPKHQIPHWALKNVRQAQLAMQQYIPMKSVLKYFDSKKCTPDLRDLFKGIDPKKLKRTSSAIWKTPPRYSMMDRSIIKD